MSSKYTEVLERVILQGRALRLTFATNIDAERWRKNAYRARQRLLRNHRRIMNDPQATIEIMDISISVQGPQILLSYRESGPDPLAYEEDRCF